jgi:hypothetical protein
VSAMRLRYLALSDDCQLGVVMRFLIGMVEENRARPDTIGDARINAKPETRLPDGGAISADLRRTSNVEKRES